MTCVGRCPDNTTLLGCCDGSIRLLGPGNCRHAIDCAPIVCCCSAEVESGAVLVAACTRETLHLRLLDQDEPSRVLQEHQCPLNTILPHRSESHMLFSPCSRHLLVADGCSVSTYSMADASMADAAVSVTRSDSHSAHQTAQDEVNIKNFQLSMTFHGPHHSQQILGEDSIDSGGDITLPVAYWRSQPPTKHASNSSTYILMHALSFLFQGRAWRFVTGCI